MGETAGVISQGDALPLHTSLGGGVQVFRNRQLRGSVHRQARSLFMFKTEVAGKKGILTRPQLAKEEETFALPRSFMDSKCAESFRDFCRCSLSG